MKKELLKKIYQVAEPFIWFLLTIVIFQLFVGAGSLESVLYGFIAVGLLTVFESVMSLIFGCIKGAKAAFTMKKMQLELARMAKKENVESKGE